MKLTFVRLCYLAVVLLNGLTHAADNEFPFRVLRDVPLDRVTINDEFWRPRMQLWQAKTIRDCFAKFERDGALRNFEKIRDGGAGKHHEGSPWFDGLVYEMIRGSSDFIACEPDSELQKQLAGYVHLICDAAEKDPNCYLNTYTQLEEPNHRWGQNGGNLRWQHDVYNVGCLIDAAVHYYQATGETRFLKVATRLALHMAATMGWPPKDNVVPGHALPEEALVKLYRLHRDHPELEGKLGMKVDEDAILALAEFFVQGRGHTEGRRALGSYAQDDRPIFEQQTIEGHAVRATLLGAGMAALAVERPGEPYANVAERWWSNMTHRRMYVTGGVGAIADDERFGNDYELPNDGYLEICASVGAAFFHHNMQLATGDARYANEFERGLYNGVLSGVSLSGDRYLYVNPPNASAKDSRWDWHPCPCCPPMFLKVMGSLPGYIYSVTDDSIYVNLFIGSEARLDVGGAEIRVRQTTEFPWGGSVKLVVEPVSPVSKRLAIRRPDWCVAPQLKVNGEVMGEPQVERGYAVIDRQWKAGDVVELELEMTPEFVVANPNVAMNVGRVAVRRGPVVYCFEAADNSNLLASLYTDRHADLKVEHRGDLLGGIDVIRCPAQIRSAKDQDNPLYQSVAQDHGDERTEAIAIPFFAHSNRKQVGRMVWIPTTAVLAQPRKVATVASQATWTASHCFAGDTVDALGDQLDTKASDDSTIPRFTWWDHRGTSEWVQCDFAAATEVSSVSVYWWDERRINAHCRTPKSWRVLALRGGQWEPIEGQSVGGAEMDRFNTINFPKQNFDALRIEAELQPEWSGGILEIEIE